MIRTISILIITTLIPLKTFADGLTDLHNALTRLDNQQAVSARIHLQSRDFQGDKKVSDLQLGEVNATIHSDERGLQVRYNRDILSAIAREELERANSNDAQTPTLNALWEMNTTKLNDTLSAAQSLRRDVEAATLLSEESIHIDGQDQRQLTFEISTDVINKRQQKYVKHFDGKLHVWIDNQGTPIKSQKTIDIKGRAFIFITFKAKEEHLTNYLTVNGRLVASHKRSHYISSGMGENFDKSVEHQLTLESKSNTEIRLSMNP